MHASTTDYDDEEVEAVYSHGQLQGAIHGAPKKDILFVQGDWNARIGKDAQNDWEETCRSSCNNTTNERGLRILEVAKYNNL